MRESDAANVGHVDVRALRFLARVLETRSVTRAGESMGLSQPAASRLLGQLRRAFGDDPLLVRKAGGGYVPTARAVELMPALAEALGATERLFAPAGFDPASSTRTVRLAATDYGAAVALVPLARELAAAAPGISLDVGSWTPDTLERLEGGGLDLALYPDTALPVGFRHLSLFADGYACLVRRDHPVLAHRDEHGLIDPARLAELPRVLLLYPEGVATRVDDPLAAHGPSRAAGTFRTPYFLCGPLLVADSDHALCVPRRSADLMTRMGDVVAVDLPAAGGFGYGLIWHERGDADPCLSWVRERVAASVTR